MKLVYVSGELAAGDGAQIFDKKLVASLRQSGAEVQTLHPHRIRSIGLPLWRGRIVENDLASRLQEARKAGARIVLSHEAFFGLADSVQADAIVVHNYMPCFRFPRKAWLEAYFRLGGRSYFGRAFSRAAAVFFVSHRDHRAAVADFPGIAARSHVIPPPPQLLATGARRDDLIHVSGSEAWLPKRLSRLNEKEVSMVKSRSFTLSDFGDCPNPAFGLITDRFSIGFKLKLMQMLHVGDAIASLSEIGEEIAAIAPEYPYWCEVSSVEEALDWFQRLRDEGSVEDLDRKMTAARVSLRLPSWPETGRRVASILAQRESGGVPGVGLGEPA